MKLLHKILFSLQLVLITLVAKSQDVAQLFFPNQINIIPNCSITKFEKKIQFTTDSKKDVRLYSFQSNSVEYTICYNGKAIRENDTFKLSKAKPAIFILKFESIPKNQDSLYLSFQSDVENYKKEAVGISFKQFSISNADVHAGKSHIIELSKSCLDSISVIFPSAGTQTSIAIYKAGNTKKAIRNIWYDAADNESNCIVFFRPQIGRYFVRLRSCHWGNGFWLTIK